MQDLILCAVIVNGYGAIIEMARQRHPAFQVVIQCFADSRAIMHKIGAGRSSKHASPELLFLAVFGGVNPAPDSGLRSRHNASTTQPELAVVKD